MSYRETLNEIKQRHELTLIYQDAVTGPSHSQVWLGSWMLVNTGRVIGSTSASSRTGAKEEAARLAVLWLNASGYF